MRDDPLVSRAAPFTCTLSERFDVWPVDKQVSERERLMDIRISAAGERPQRKAAVHQRVNTACLESAKERGEAEWLTEWLATEHGHTVTGFTDRVQQHVNENVHRQRHASIWRVGLWYEAGGAAANRTPL